jgi:hypothetical protein
MPGAEVLESGPDVGPIRCRLRQDGTWPFGSDDLIAELENVSEKPVRLWESPYPRKLTYLTRNRRTNKVTGCFFRLYGLSTGIPRSQLSTVVLQPGERLEVREPMRDLKSNGTGDHLSWGVRLEAVFIYRDNAGYPEPGQDYFARSNAVVIGW